MEMDRLIAGIGQKVQINEGIKVEPRYSLHSEIC